MPYFVTIISPNFICEWSSQIFGTYDHCDHNYKFASRAKRVTNCAQVNEVCSFFSKYTILSNLLICDLA